MTAVVGFADVDVAFIATDTKRVGGFAAAAKSHIWSDHILIGQSGCATFMTKAIDYMFKCRSVTGDGLQSAINAFKQGRRQFHPEAVKALGSAHADGTLLITSSNAADGEPALWTIPLDRQVPGSPVAGPVAGIGDPLVAQAALAAWASASSHSSYRLPSWGIAVIDSLVGPTIGWPVDLLLARSSVASGQRIVVRQRLLDVSAAYDPAFA